jgi:hypothetical protein
VDGGGDEMRNGFRKEEGMDQRGHLNRNLRF